MFRYQLVCRAAVGQMDRRVPLLRTEAAQGGRAAGKESFADREREINVVNHAVAVAVGRVEELGDAEIDVDGEDRAAHALRQAAEETGATIR